MNMHALNFEAARNDLLCWNASALCESDAKQVIRQSVCL